MQSAASAIVNFGVYIIPKLYDFLILVKNVIVRVLGNKNVQKVLLAVVGYFIGTLGAAFIWGDYPNEKDIVDALENVDL